MNTGAIDDDIKLKHQIRAAIKAYNKGLTSHFALRFDSDKKYHEEYLSKMAVQLSREEIATIDAASATREKGLHLIRSGDLVGGALALKEATVVFEYAKLSKEAKLIIDSYQMAAEAYLHYSKGIFSEAYKSLIKAIKFCHLLRDDYGYPIEVRRIHLARNIVRVLSFSGEHIVAMEIACLLIRYLNGEQDSWPLTSLKLTSTPETMEMEEKCCLVDQILAEITLLINNRH
jgi:hypothetical protein